MTQKIAEKVSIQNFRQNRYFDQLFSCIAVAGYWD